MKKPLYWLGIFWLLTLSARAANITWTGTNGNTWDTGSTINWNNAGTAVTFSTGNNVTFDDTSSNGTVTISGNVQPGTITVSNSATTYTFGGSGSISGAGSLLKSGMGTLIISTTNSFTQGTDISAGTIIVTNSGALSTVGTITLGDANTGTNSTALLFSSSASAFTFSRPIVVSANGSGTVTIGGSGTAAATTSVSSSITLNRATTFESTPSGTLNLNSMLSGTGSAIFSGGGLTQLTTTTGSGAWTGGISVTGNSVLVSSTSTSFGGSHSLNVDAGSGIALGAINSGSFTTLTGSGNVGGYGSSISFGVGSSNASSTFYGIIGGTTINGYTMNSAVNLTKVGSGTLTLAGINTYTGTTKINSGELALTGSGSINSSSTINIASGAKLAAPSFTLGSSQSLTAGRTSAFANDIIGNFTNGGTINIAGSGTAGTLTISGNLALTGGTLLFDFSNTTTSGSHVNDLISIGGSLSLSGTTLITPSLLNGSLATGTYTLVTGGSSLVSGNSSDLSWAGNVIRQNVAFDTTTAPGTIYMIVTGTSASLIWTGSNGSTWDTGNTASWNDAGTADKFFAGDKVTFNDSSSNGSVVLAGSLQPSSITVTNNLTAYAFSGSGQITGASNLLKSGTGTLSISNTNAYTGGTVISAGTVIAANANALGSGTVTLGDANTGTNNVALLLNPMVFSQSIAVSNQGSGTATIGARGTGGSVILGGNIVVNRPTIFQSVSGNTLFLEGALSGTGGGIFTGGGIVQLQGVDNAWSGGISVTGNTVLSSGSFYSIGANHSLNVDAGSGMAFNSGTSTTLTALTGAGNVGSSGPSMVNIAVGGSNASSTFNGVIGGATINGYSIGSAINLTKVGTGTLTLGGANTYTGTTNINQGSLALTGAGSIASSSAIKIVSGATLDVSSLASGTLGGAQTLTAGRITGFASDIIGNFSSNGTINIAGTGTAGTLTIDGNLSLNGGNLFFDLAGTTTVGTHVNDLISIGGSLSLSGTTLITPTLLNNTLVDGTYTLINGGSGLVSGNGSDFAWGGPAIRQTVTFDTSSTPGTVYMVVTGSSGNLTWTGSGGNTWSPSSGGWSSGSSSSGTAAFDPLDTVTFNDSSSNGNVQLSGSLQPGTVLVNNGTTSYTFSGSGQITGGASLIKSGTGTLTISNTNSYTGATNVTNGTLTVNGNIANSVITVSAGAKLAGHGIVGTIGGAGLVAPGDPQILTGTQVDPSGGTSFRFQMGLVGSPIYNNPTASGNDVIHLTGDTPFLFALTSANTITVDFTGLSLVQGDILYGGFFTDADVSSSWVSNATFVYTGLGGLYAEFEGFAPVSSANFDTGPVSNGQVMEFLIVPEPRTWIEFTIGAAAMFLALRLRRKSC